MLAMRIRSTRSLLVCGAAAIGLIAATPAWAQQRTFDVPAQPANKAIPEFARQAGVQIVAPGSALRGKRTAPLKGEHDVRAALRQLLQGTDLRVASDDGVTITLARGEVGNGGSGGSEAARGGASLGSGEAQAGGAAADSGSADNDIIVTGSRLPGVLPASPLIQITREDIQRQGFTTTSQVLESVTQNFSGGSPNAIGGNNASQTIPARQGYGATPSLRGLGDATLTLVDGRRLAPSGFGYAADISMIPISAIERIDILTDGASAVYGADAIAGVVNVVLRRGGEGVEVAGTVSAPTRGGGILQRYDISGGPTWATGSFFAAYSYQAQEPLFARDRAFASNAATPAFTLVAGQSSHHIMAHINQDLGSSISLESGVVALDRTSRDHLALAGFDLGISRKTSSQVAGYLSLRADLSSGWELQLSGSLAYDSEWSYVSPILRAIGSRDTHYYTETASLEGSARGTIFNLPTGPVPLVLGAGIQRENFNQEGLQMLRGSRENIYAYAELNFPFVRRDDSRVGLQQLELNASARMDRYSGNEASFSPKAGLVYRPLNELRFRATWGESFRLPTFSQLSQPRTGVIRNLADPTSPTGSTITLQLNGGNPDLKPESSRSYSATVDFFPMPRLRLSATYYHYDFSDRIRIPTNLVLTYLMDPALAPFVIRNASQSQVNDASFGLQSLVNVAGPNGSLANVTAIANGVQTNVARWRASGVDLSAMYDLTAFGGNLNVQMSATHLNLRQRLLVTSQLTTVSGLAFNPPELKFRGGVFWSNERWNISAFGNYIGGSRETTSPTSRRVASLATIDLQLGYNWQDHNGRSGTRVAVGLQNALDRSPPFVSSNVAVYPGLNYDTANSSPLGRVFTFHVSRRW